MKRILVLDEGLNDLMEASDLAQDERSIKQALRNFTTAVGFNRFAYLNVRAGDVRALSTLSNGVATRLSRQQLCDH